MAGGWRAAALALALLAAASPGGESSQAPPPLPAFAAPDALPALTQRITKVAEAIPLADVIPAAKAAVAPLVTDRDIGSRHRLAARLRLLASRARALRDALAAGMAPHTVLRDNQPDPAHVNCVAYGTTFEYCTYENVCLSVMRYNADRWGDRVLMLLGHTHEHELLPGSYGYRASDSDTALHPRLAELAREKQAAQLRAAAPIRSRVEGCSVNMYFQNHMYDIWMASDIRPLGNDDVIKVHGLNCRHLPLNLLNNGIAAVVAPMSEGVPVEFGGSWNGTITWLDSVWIANGVTGSNLAEYTSSVVTPFINMAFYNASAGLGLPPLDNVWVDFQAGAWYISYKDDPEAAMGQWIARALNSTLAFMRPGRAKPKVGRHIHLLEKGKRERQPHYAALVDFVKEAVELCCDTPWEDATKPGKGGKPIGVDEACLATIPRCLREKGRMAPPDMFLFQQAYAASRVIYNEDDVPVAPTLPEVLAEALGGVKPDKGTYKHRQRAFPVPQPWIPQPARHRICMKKMVLPGRSLSYVPQGEVEMAWRKGFGVSQISAGDPAAGATGPPPLKVLLLDRTKGDLPEGRYFENRPAMEAVLRRHGVAYDLLTEEQFTHGGFAEQIRMFSGYSIVIAPHGAHLSSVWTMARRGVLIEIQARAMWCANFIKGYSGSGVFTLPMHSRLRPYLTRYSGPQKEEVLNRYVGVYETCDKLSMLETAGDWPCWEPMRFLPIRVPVAEFELQLVRALEMVAEHGVMGSAGAAMLTLEGAVDACVPGPLPAGGEGDGGAPTWLRSPPLPGVSASSFYNDTAACSTSKLALGAGGELPEDEDAAAALAWQLCPPKTACVVGANDGK